MSTTRILTYLVWYLPAFAVASPSFEEDALTRAFGHESLISIATGTKQPISLAPAVASVITADDIREMGATDLDQVLESVPGLHVSTAPRGYLPLYTIRGIYSENNPQVLVLINDIPITNLYVGNRGELWGGMPVQDIARIEIIRGPGSAVYGADAFAGTINIITKSPKDIDGAEFGVRAGSFDTQEAWALYSSSWRNVDLAFSLQYQTTDGHSEHIEADAQTVYDQVFETAVSRAPGPANLGKDSLELRLTALTGPWQLRVGYQGRDNIGGGAGVALALDPAASGRSERINADLSYGAALSQHWDINGTLSYFDTSAEPDLVLYPPGAFGNAFPEGMIARPYIYEQHTRLSISTLYHGFEEHSLRLGLGATYSDMYRIREVKNYAPDGSPLGSVLDVSSNEELVFMRPHDRTIYYVFAQDEWTLSPDWRLTSGIRHDHYSDFGNTTNPRFALVWTPRYDTTTKLLYGRAFRAPAFNELYNINNPVALGNPHLKPETIDTYEFAVNYRHSPRLQTGINLFKYRMQDVIRFMPRTGTPEFVASNTGEIDGYGMELEATYSPVPSLRLMGNYAYQRSTDELVDRRVANAPAHQVYVRANWTPHPAWAVTAQSTWIADRKREGGDPRADIDDYAIADLTLRYRSDYGVGPWELAASVRNVFDEDAREPSPRLFPDGTPMIPHDLPLAGRHFFVEARYHIGR